MRRTLPVYMLCTIALHVMPAQAGLHAEIVDYGETTAEQERPAAPTPDDHSLVPRTVIEGIRFVNHTSSLSAQLCQRFGVLVRLVPSAGERLPRQLMVVIAHPRITRPDQVSSTRDSFPTPIIGDQAYAGWTFDHLWELQTGEWTITFLSAGEVVASKTFTISALTPVGSVCQPNAVS